MTQTPVTRQAASSTPAVLDPAASDPITLDPVTLDPVKAKHRAMWAFGDYDRVAVEVISDLGQRLVEAAAIQAGETVLDVAAGSGNASLPAARAGGVVTATDLTPELLQIGHERAGRAGLEVRWVEADAEHLPCSEARYDVALSCVGVMFAPFHQPVADELVRVVRPGGRVALANWTPSGFIGQMFAAMKPFVAPPPPGASPGPLWGDADHVRGLFGDRLTDLQCRAESLPITRFGSAKEFVDFFASYYGPTIAAYRNVADDPARTEALTEALTELAREHGADSGSMSWEYLLVTGTRS